jgi:hypothetical protein
MINEVSPELVGKVNKARLQKPNKTEASRSTLARAVKKAWLKSSVGKIKEDSAVPANVTGTAVTGTGDDPATWVKGKKKLKNIFKRKELEEEKDYEGQMAKAQLQLIAKRAAALAEMMTDEMELDAWVQSKITTAEDYVTTVHDYMTTQKEQVVSPGEKKWQAQTPRNSYGVPTQTMSGVLPEYPSLTRGGGVDTQPEAPQNRSSYVAPSQEFRGIPNRSQRPR